MCGCRPRPESSVYLQWPFFFSRKRTIPHELHCPHSAGKQAVTDNDVRFSLCSVALKRRLDLSMVLSSSSWGNLKIKHSLKFARFVDRDSPAHLLLDADRVWQLEEAERNHAFLETADLLLRLFQEQKATPHDRLEDGSTLLHVNSRTSTS